MLRILLASGWLLIPAGLPRADAQDDPNEPPLVGQPANFSGAVGSYKIAASAQPTTLQAEDPLTFTVRITGHGPADHPPTRPDLRHLAAVTKRFAVEDLDQKADAAAGVWEFRYRLKPLNAEVTDIPPLRFVYFKPGILPKEKGYQSAYSDSIPLMVKPRTEVQVTEVQGQKKVSQYPDEVYHLKEGMAVLRKDEPFAFPGWFPLLLLVLVPPAYGIGIYLLGCRLKPDAARRLRQRRSRAANKALFLLSPQRSWKDSDPSIHQIATITADYLHERWELKTREPTPSDVAGHFRQIDCPVAMIERIAMFFRACDVARFAAAGGDANHLRETAREIIFALEEQS